ncbi:DUF5317 domain-containing protein [bacterium]|nr:DUF5317 domain-containing protein [bacterium]
MLPELIIIGLIIAWLTGGKLDRLADLKIRCVWVLVLAVALSFTSWAFRFSPTLREMHWLAGIVQMAEKFAFLAFVLANLRIAGAKLVVTGMVANLLALSVNGGLMPASKWAVVFVFGKKAMKMPIHNSLMDSSTKLGFLCDIIPMRWPYALLPEICSIGDILITLGIVVAIIVGMRMPSHKEIKASAEA